MKAVESQVTKSAQFTQTLQLNCIKCHHIYI